MNGSLAKHYDQLTPWERVPLLVAAAVRDDAVEVQRLGSSAPRACYRVAEHWGLLEALGDVASFYLLRQLDLAFSFGEAIILLDQPLSRGRQQRLEGLLRMLAYRIVACADGWHQLCAEWAIDPEVLVRELPGYERMGRVTTQARGLAFSEAEARTYLTETSRSQRGGTDGPAEYRLVTATDAADALRTRLRARLELWGIEEYPLRRSKRS